MTATSKKHVSATGRHRFSMVLILLTVATGLVLVISVGVGQVHIPASEVTKIIWSHLRGRPSTVDPIFDQIVWTVRLPRAILAVVVGAGLALSGAVIQAVVRNPMGDPYLIGIVPGASLGAVVVIVLGTSAAGGLSVSAAAFLGAMLAFTLTFVLGRQQGGGWPPVRVVLAGVAVGYAASALTFFLQVRASPNEISRVLFWSLGSVSGAEWSDLGLVSGVTVAGCGWLLIRRRRLNALVGGDDLARSLGLNVARFQLTLMVLASVVTAAVVSVSGGIGFVGLVVPHVARMFVGADHGRVLPVSAVLGALFLLLADQAARTLLAPAELPIGVVTAAVGAPFFMWLLWASGRQAATR